METTLVDELEQAAKRADFIGMQCSPAAVGSARSEVLRAEHAAEAVALRARAAHVVELQRKANEYPLAMSYECRVINAIAGPLVDAPEEPGK